MDGPFALFSETIGARKLGQSKLVENYMTSGQNVAQLAENRLITRVSKFLDKCKCLECQFSRGNLSLKFNDCVISDALQKGIVTFYQKVIFHFHRWMVGNCNSWVIMSTLTQFLNLNARNYSRIDFGQDRWTARGRVNLQNFKVNWAFPNPKTSSREIFIFC